MKNSLILENNEILQDLIQLSLSIKEKPAKESMTKCISNFRKLTDQWLNFVHNSETALKITIEKNKKSESSIRSLKSLIRVNTEKIQKKIERKEKKILTKESKIASQISIFPKLWEKNLKKLRKKSMSWRITPFAQVQYDQEFSFLNRTKKEKIEESEIKDVSLEFDRIMQEISMNKAEEKYDPEKFSIEKSFGGWKSEFESECEGNSNVHNASEIKNAISILYKANLLKPESRPILSKITEIVKKPENSADLALFLQLLNINTSVIPSFAEKNSENDVKMEELLEATSFLSSFGPKSIENSVSEMSYEQEYITQFRDYHKKTLSLGKNSTKDMTETLHNKN